MIERLLELRVPVDIYTYRQNLISDDLKEDTLTYKDWQDLADFKDLLAPIKTLSTRQQGNAIDGTHGALQEWLSSVNMSLTHFKKRKEQLKYEDKSFFKTSVILGWKKLEKYYQLSD